MGKDVENKKPFLKRIDGVKGLYALKVNLAPMEQRPGSACASLGRWILYLPGYHAFWNVYSWHAAHLREIPGTEAPTKQFSEATHELVLLANDPKPEWQEKALTKGAIAHLGPANIVKQVTCPDDATCAKLQEQLAIDFVNANLFPEPQGITVNGVPAKEYMSNYIDNVLKDILGG